MKIKKLYKNNFAVAGVIEFLLIVAMIAIIIGIIQYSYIPEFMKQRESDHLDEVENQFSFLKAIIDLQGTTKEDIPVSSPITLGSNNIPYFVTLGALGEIHVIEDISYNINIDFDTLILPLTAIEYTAHNYYYYGGNNIFYSLEGGALILKQPDGEVVKVEPSILIENLTNTINIYYDLPVIVGISGKKDTSTSNEIAYVRTNYSSSDTNYQSISDVTSIKINTKYPDAWYNLTENLLKTNVNLIKGIDNVEITQKAKIINFYYKRIYIYAQLSPGFIK